jgi:hypothetical protein
MAGLVSGTSRGGGRVEGGGLMGSRCCSPGMGDTGEGVFGTASGAVVGARGLARGL